MYKDIHIMCVVCALEYVMYCGVCQHMGIRCRISFNVTVADTKEFMIQITSVMSKILRDFSDE